MHLRMSPLKFVLLPIERPLCGGQIRWSYVGSGSCLDSPPGELAAQNLSSGLMTQVS